MYSSFYTAAAGASAQQAKMNVVSNNMANINTVGYKTRTPIFADLLYTNYQDPVAGHLQEGNGIELSKTDIDFDKMGALMTTGDDLDFAIKGNGFFAVQDYEGEGEIEYTRDGRFFMTNYDGTFYLTNTDGKVVLDSDESPIEITSTSQDLDIGVFNIAIRDGLMPSGNSDFLAVEKNGEIEAIENPELIRGSLEASTAELSKEMSLVIESQRAYSYALKMVQTSDEVEQEVNSLRR